MAKRVNNSSFESEICFTFCKRFGKPSIVETHCGTPPLKQIGQLVGTNVSATDVTENRERRFLGFGIFFTISKALKGIKLICSGVMWLRSRYDQDLRRIIEQTEKALEETKNIKEEIDILRIQFESAKKELRVAYDVFSSSTTNLKTLVVAAEDTARKKQTLQTSV